MADGESRLFPELAPLNSDALTTVHFSVTLDKLLSKSILFREDNILLSLSEFSPLNQEILTSPRPPTEPFVSIWTGLFRL